MCGIVGYIAEEKKDVEVGLDLIRHRGPDGGGCFEEKFGRYYVGLGHRRLSIIDLNVGANQPLFTPDGSMTIVFNGEIYNYQQLRRQYLAEYKFVTNSDTEVILGLYSKFGKESIKLLEGMFAFVILDQLKNKVVVARDQLGIKPLYYTFENGSVFFASEIKAFAGFGLKPKIDEKLIYEFLLNNFIHEPETGFSNIRKVNPGTYVEVDLMEDISEANWRETTYWRIQRAESNINLEEEIDYSIKQHLVSDVPVGLFFSGGVDSSVLLSRLRDSVTSLTVKPDPRSVEIAGVSSDYNYAVEIARELGVKKLIEVPLEEHMEFGEHLFYSLEQTAKLNEELIGDFTFVSSRKISAEARKHNLKVALSGMGADEVFAGYPRYVMMRYFNLLGILSNLGIFRLLSFILSAKKSFRKKIDRFQSFFSETSLIYKYCSLVGYFSKDEIKGLLKQEFLEAKMFECKMEGYLKGYEKESPLKKAMLIDAKGYLSHNFMVADKSSMLESLEIRVPLATSRLCNMIFSMDDNHLIHGTKTKRPLKELLEKILHPKLVNRSKAGFNPPLDVYVDSLNESEILKYLKSGNLFCFMQEKKVMGIISDHFCRKKNNTYKIFSLLYLTAWLKVNS